MNIFTVIPSQWEMQQKLAEGTTYALRAEGARTRATVFGVTTLLGVMLATASLQHFWVAGIAGYVAAMVTVALALRARRAAILLRRRADVAAYEAADKRYLLEFDANHRADEVAKQRAVDNSASSQQCTALVRHF